MIMLKPIWIQIWRVLKTWCKVSYCTLHMIGYIMTRRPTTKMLLAKNLVLMSLLPAALLTYWY